MKGISTRAVLATACLAAASLVDAHAARAQQATSDSLTCVNVSSDKRFAKTPRALTLTPEDAQFMTSQGCKVVGGTQIARADRLCYPTSVEERGGDPGSDGTGTGTGIDLSGQVYLCYDVRCQRDEMNVGGRTELNITDQFGDGQLFINERPTTKELCVPAFVGTPTPTPGPSATPGVTPTPVTSPPPTSTPGATATPVATATPAPTETPGSASRAFVAPIASLLQ